MCDGLNIPKSTYYYHAYLSGKDVEKAEDIEISKGISRFLKKAVIIMVLVKSKKN